MFRHYNAHSIGVCYEGGLDEKGRAADTRTPAQKKALITLLCSLKHDYPYAEIVGLSSCVSGMTHHKNPPPGITSGGSTKKRFLYKYLTTFLQHVSTLPLSPASRVPRTRSCLTCTPAPSASSYAQSSYRCIV